MEEIINYGVIEGQRRDDYLGGTLPYEVRVPDGNWEPYLPPAEFQRVGALETMACVTFSDLNSIESQHKLLTGFHRNFSDRFTARMSGTTKEGNYLWKVADSVRRDGLVNEELWPWDPLKTFTWEEYYKTPPIDVINKGREFLNEWDVAYEWVDVTYDSMVYHLRHAPLQVVVPGHAVLNFYRNSDIQKYFDTYSPFIKTRVEPFLSALKIVLTKKTIMITDKNIDALYQAVFHRPADAGGKAFWIGKSIEQFLVDVQSSEEFKKYDPLFKAAKAIEEWARQ